MSVTASSTALAIESPSNVDVPLPISSRMSRLRIVAFCKMVATSTISTMNVLCPYATSSDAPMRVKIRSVIAILADAAGTKLPICAISAINATWRIYVLLPAMFGPVMTIVRF